jgi:hypothetical protein
MPRAGFEHATPATERPQTYALDRVATGIGFPIGSQLEYRVPLGVSVITHTIRHTVGLPWTSDQPVAEASSGCM